MNRITSTMLDAVVRRINEMTGSPSSPYSCEVTGKMQHNVGNYHLCATYNGWKLERVANEQGGTRDVLSSGYISKRDLYIQMHAFIRGLENAK